MFTTRLKIAAVFVAVIAASATAGEKAAARKDAIKGQVIKLTPEGQVILSAGKADGVKIGFEFDVTRAGKKVGALKVAAFDAKGQSVCEPIIAAPEAGGKNFGSGGLGPKCRGMAFTADIGKCGSCARGTSSGAFKLCSACAKHFGKCQACGARFKKPAGAPDIRVGDLAATRLTVVPGGKKPAATKLKLVTLGDIHALWGGRSVSVKGDGTVSVAVVDRRRKRSVYELKLSAAEVKALEKLVADGKFFTMTTNDRPGVPDEARPTVTVELVSGKKRSVSKWANDKHAGFDPVYNWLLALAKRAGKAKPVVGMVITK